MPDRDRQYVSRGGIKLAAALETFGIRVEGWVCADLGSSVGGFVDCLLQHGAAKVYAIDTCYGTLAWRLRKDPRVVVLERCNAMRVTLPEAVDGVTIDVGWTRQEHILPAAVRMLKPGGTIITLIKPHYEADPARLREGCLPPEDAAAVLQATCARIDDCGLEVLQTIESPIRGRKGNREYLALVRRRE